MERTAPTPPRAEHRGEPTTARLDAQQGGHAVPWGVEGPRTLRALCWWEGGRAQLLGGQALLRDHSEEPSLRDQ